MSNPITGRTELPELEAGPLGPDAGPQFRFTNPIGMADAAAFEFISLTSKQVVVEIHGIRGREDHPTYMARTSWDGNADCVLKVRNRNWAANGDVGAIQAAMFQCQNRVGANVAWMRCVDIEIDNRYDVAGHIKALRLSVRNNANGAVGQVVDDDVIGLEVEMLSQGICVGDDVAINLIHNDASSVASEPIGINFKSSRATNGFQFAIRTEEYGIDKKGAASAESAFLKLYDDSENADLASAVAGAATGVIKVVIGTTVGYVPMYTSYTAA